MNFRKSIIILIGTVLFLIVGLVVTKDVLYKDKWLYYNILFDKNPDKFLEKQWVNLDGYWSIKAEDDSTYAQPGINEDSWNIDRFIFMSLIKKENTTFWFRKHFMAPLIKTDDSLILRLSSLTSKVQVYLNGSKIADSCFLFNKSYCCHIPNYLIHLGKDNLIAVRAKTMDQFNVHATSNIKDNLFRTLLPDYSLAGTWTCADKKNLIAGNKAVIPQKDTNIFIPMSNGTLFTSGKSVWLQKSFGKVQITENNLLFVLGKVNGFYEVYLNGIRIGEPFLFNTRENFLPA